MSGSHAQVLNCTMGVPTGVRVVRSLGEMALRSNTRAMPKSPSIATSRFYTAWGEGWDKHQSRADSCRLTPKNTLPALMSR